MLQPYRETVWNLFSLIPSFWQLKGGGPKRWDDIFSVFQQIGESWAVSGWVDSRCSLLMALNVWHANHDGEFDLKPSVLWMASFAKITRPWEIFVQRDGHWAWRPGRKDLGALGCGVLPQGGSICGHIWPERWKHHLLKRQQHSSNSSPPTENRMTWMCWKLVISANGGDQIRELRRKNCPLWGFHFL